MRVTRNCRWLISVHVAPSNLNYLLSKTMQYTFQAATFLMTLHLPQTISHIHNYLLMCCVIVLLNYLHMTTLHYGKPSHMILPSTTLLSITLRHAQLLHARLSMDHTELTKTNNLGRIKNWSKWSTCMLLS